MFEDIVSEVKGTWKRQEYDEVKSLHLTWIVEGTLIEGWFRPSEIGALSTWLAQPKPPTPEQIAARLVERWDRNTDLAEMAWGEKLADLERHIAAAIEAERAREGAT